MKIDQITAYAVIETSADDLKEFVLIVNQSIKDGWQPFGSPIYVAANTTIVQTMIKCSK